MKNLVIFGKRWFNERKCHTYFSANIFVDGKFFQYLPMQYGYGTHYLDVATDTLFKAGKLPGLKVHSNGSMESLYSYCERKNIMFLTQCADVARKLDL